VPIGVIVTLMHELQLVPDIGNIIPIMRVPYTATTNDYACARGCLLGIKRDGSNEVRKTPNRVGPAVAIDALGWKPRALSKNGAA
jgi:hypothetical protein